MCKFSSTVCSVDSRPALHDRMNLFSPYLAGNGTALITGARFSKMPILIQSTGTHASSRDALMV